MKLLSKNLQFNDRVILFNTHSVPAHLSACMLSRIYPTATILSCDYSLLPMFMEKAHDYVEELHLIGFKLAPHTENNLRQCCQVYHNYIGRTLTEFWAELFGTDTPSILKCIDSFNLKTNQKRPADEYIYYGMIQEILPRLDGQVSEYSSLLFNSQESDMAVAELAANGNAVRNFLSSLAQSYVNRAYISNHLKHLDLKIYICNCSKSLSRFISGTIGPKHMSIVYEEIIINDVPHTSWTIDCSAGIDVVASVTPSYSCVGTSNIVGFFTKRISPVDLVASINWVEG